MGNSVSDIGLTLCAIPMLVHGAEVVFPTIARIVANFVLPPCGLTLPVASLSYDEQMSMLQAAIAAAPTEKIIAAKDVLFVMLFESRQGGAAFLSAAAASYYTSTLVLEERHPVHFLFFVLSVLMCLANANHVGLPFGEHPLVSDNGWWVGFWFVPFWFASAYCNYKAFQLSKKKSKTA